MAFLSIGQVWATDPVTIEADFTNSNSQGGTSPDFFFASGGAAGSYYGLKQGSIVSDLSYDVDPSQSISVSMKVGTYGSYAAGKQSVLFYAVNNNGETISTTYTASFTAANKNGATFNGTITLNDGQSGSGIKFKFASSSSATSSVYARFYNLSVTYTPASSGSNNPTVFLNHGQSVSNTL